MSRHEGVSCDSCMKANFRGKRYKCLICYDYDLCGTCYEAGATNTRHTPDHAMQCILTRSDFVVWCMLQEIHFKDLRVDFERQ
uniref:RING-type E3 ubiquitin transferase n=1 Tax=Rhipicephalus zambeziensis TaxID=60191 RepID=A0A224YVJ9_9ACAR